MPKTFSLFLTLTLLLSACAEESLPEPPSSEDLTVEEDILAESDPMVQLAFIALEDEGNSGPLVGCGDSVVTVTSTYATFRTVNQKVTGALTTLFGVEDQNYGESGLYNALYQSELNVDTVSVSDEEIRVELSGTLLSGGTCDDPRIQAQIQETILDNAGMPANTPLVITLNGTSLDSLLNGKGE